MTEQEMIDFCLAYSINIDYKFRIILEYKNDCDNLVLEVRTVSYTEQELDGLSIDHEFILI
jgi:plasmid maintenance system killer protein